VPWQRQQLPQQGTVRGVLLLDGDRGQREGGEAVVYEHPRSVGGMAGGRKLADDRAYMCVAKVSSHN